MYLIWALEHLAWEESKKIKCKFDNNYLEVKMRKNNG